MHIMYFLQGSIQFLKYMARFRVGDKVDLGEIEVRIGRGRGPSSAEGVPSGEWRGMQPKVVGDYTPFLELNKCSLVLPCIEGKQVTCGKGETLLELSAHITSFSRCHGDTSKRGSHHFQQKFFRS